MAVLLSALSLSFIVVAGFLVDKHLRARFAQEERDLVATEEAVKAEMTALLTEQRGLESDLLQAENQLIVADWHAHEQPMPKESAAPVSPLSPPAHPRAAGKQLMTLAQRNESQGRWLLSNGKISLEQHEKAVRLVGQVGPDLLQTCLLLNYIDKDTAKKVQEAFA